MALTLCLHPADSVATALRGLSQGEAGAREAIPRGHKIALLPIATGAPVRKYGQIIGYAATEIAQGAHVHTHNLAFRAVTANHDIGTNLRPAVAPPTRDSFQGYRRENGKVGTRNFIAVVTSVNCSATAARQIAAHNGPR